MGPCASTASDPLMKTLVMTTLPPAMVNSFNNEMANSFNNEMFSNVFNTKIELNSLKDWSVTLSANILNYNLSYNHSERLSVGQNVSIDSVRIGFRNQDHRTELKNTYGSSKSSKNSGVGLSHFEDPLNFQFGDLIEVSYKPINYGISYNWVNYNSVKSEGYGIDFNLEKNDNNLSGSYYNIGNNTGYTLSLDLDKNELNYGTNKGNNYDSNNIYLKTSFDNYTISYSNDNSDLNGTNVENNSVSLGYNIINNLPALAIEDEELIFGLKYNF
jgi:hypothetical protein